MCHGRSRPLNGADSTDPITPSKCVACRDAAVPGDVYCVGHRRLGEYRVTTDSEWAANE